MRTGLSTIQQTLTPDALNVLNCAISEAARRRHGQTTPLHVAAALLLSPSNHLRHACLQSHPNPSSSHPLQCRALELCFSVALDRLPSSASPSDPPDEPPTSLLPPISNALMAALKRAQAHQRRGCPESQQQPLLAIKVELNHLILSILDDPSVSRVMREASFSSPAVKTSIENSLSSSPTPPPARNIYFSPRLVGASVLPVVISAREDLAKLFDILTRSEKRNPILVGDADPGVVIREAIKQIGSPDAPTALRAVAVISVEKELSLSSSDGTQIPSKIRDLTPTIEARISGGVLTGVVLDLGDLKWLVEGVSQQQRISDIGRAAVAEINHLLVQFGSPSAGVGPRLWLVGTASCATYLRCQVYFPTMEIDWDLQAVPIAPRSHPLSGLLPRVGSHGILSRKIESFSTPKGFPAISNTGVARRRPSDSVDTFCKNSLCNLCKESCERELANIGVFESEKSEGRPDARKSLPRWLQIAAMPTSSLQEQELLKKWRESCFSLHRISLPVTSEPPFTVCPLMKSGLINTIQPKASIQTISVLFSPEKSTNPAATLVKTDLALGPVQKPSTTRFTNDATSIKRLVNGLLDKFSWQAQAASAVAAAVIQSYSGAGKRRNGSPKADTWLLLAGSDRVGKQKMALTLSDLVFGRPPLIIRLGSQTVASEEEAEESNLSSRGRTTIDCVADALRVNPFTTVLLEDFDRTDSVFRGMLRRAMESGRLADSHGREVGLGNTIFILTAGWLPAELMNSSDELRLSEKRITKLATSGRQLVLQLEEKTRKRRHECLFKHERLSKPRKDSLSLDLNVDAGVAVDEEAGESSLNSSDLTVEHGLEHSNGRLIVQPPSAPSSWISELFELIDATIVFKPIDFAPLRRKVVDSISTKFTDVMGNGLSISIDNDAVDQLSGGVWLGGDSLNLLDEWIDQILVPAVEKLKGNPNLKDRVSIRLSSVKSGALLYKSYLPASVKIAIATVE